MSSVTDDGDSGLSMSHNATSFIPAGPVYSNNNAEPRNHGNCLSETSEYATATESVSSGSPENFAHKKDSTQDNVNPPQRKSKHESTAPDVKPKEPRSRSSERLQQRSEIDMDGVANVRATTNDNFTLPTNWDSHVGNIKYDLPEAGKGEKNTVQGNTERNTERNTSVEQYDIPETRPPRIPAREPTNHAHRSAKRTPMEHSYIEKQTAQQRRQQKMKETRYKTEDCPVITPPRNLKTLRQSKSEGERNDPVYVNTHNMWGTSAAEKQRKIPMNGYKTQQLTPFPTKGILRKVPPLDLSGLEETTLDDSAQLSSQEYHSENQYNSEATNGYTSEGNF